MKRFAAAALLLALLSSCGYRTVWVHPDKTGDAFLKDDYDCRVDAAPRVQLSHADRMERDCLQLRGWKPVREPRSLTAWWQRITN